MLSAFARTGLAITVSLFALAVARWPAIGAEPPLDVRALPLAGPLLGFAIVAALTGGRRESSRWKPIALSLSAAILALAALVLARGPAGLPAEVGGGAGLLGRTTPEAIDMRGRDLRAFATGRGVTLRWEGELRPPRAGAYRLWVQGRGRVSVALDGHTLLSAEGDPLRAEREIALARRATRLDVRLEQAGPGPRLSFGWTRPDGRREVVPARYLGPERSAWLWWSTDAVALAVALLAGLLAFLAPWERPRRLPEAPPVLTAPEVALAAIGTSLLLAVMSWPLVRDLVHTGPMHRPDGRLNAWILAWAGETVWTAPGRLFDAPAFHPLPDALAFSENLLLPAAVMAPLQRIGGPVLAYNVALLGSLLLSGLGAYLLVRRAGGDRLGAFTAAAYFAAGPHRWTRLPHLHAQMTVFLPFALLAFDRFLERRSLRRGLVVGLLLAFQGLASIYLGAITAAALGVAIAIGVAVRLTGSRSSPNRGLEARDLARLAAGFLLAAAVLLPLVRPYLRMREFQGQEFTIETVAFYAASLPSYVAAGTAAWGGLTQRLLDPADVRDTLFPGLVALVLGIVGLASAPRRYRAFAVVGSLVAVVFSLGPETPVYRFLHEHLLLVRGVRALSRFALVPTLALSVLAGLALSGRRRLLVLAALVLMMLESANLPLRLGRYEGPSPASRWLAGREGAVLVLPLAVDDTRAMLDGLAHGRPLVNGDSGFIPRPFDRAMELFAFGVDAEGLRFLRAVGVRHVVDGRPSPPAWTAGLRGVAAFAHERVAEVEQGPQAAVVEPGEPVATRWTSSGLVLTLDKTKTIGRVAFQLSDAEWIGEPLVEVSDDGVRWERVAATASLADATLSLYRDPRHGRGEVRFAARPARFVRLDARVPVAARSLLEVGS